MIFFTNQPNITCEHLLWSALQVYITCSVIMCENTSPYSRCAQGCLDEPIKRRRRRDTSRETDRHYIAQGPFVIVKIPGSIEALNDTMFLKMDNVQPGQ